MFGGFPFGEFFGHGMHGEGVHENSEEIDNKKYYDILGIDQSISCAEVKKQYKVLAKTKHPDKGGDPRVFAEITQAAEVLSDPEKRKVYDRFGENGVNQGMPGGGRQQDLFDMISGRVNNRQAERRSKNCGVKMGVTLNELYHGCIKSLPIKRRVVCQDCGGKGGSKVIVCTDCRGVGFVKKLVQIGPGMYGQTSGPCDICMGQGKSIDPNFKCKKCKGACILTEEKLIEVLIDKGCPDKHRYTFKDLSDEEPGLKPGDFIVVIEELGHSVFKRKKADLIMNRKISLKEALTGYCFKIDHLDGEKIVSGMDGDVVQPGDIRTIEGLGMPLVRENFKFGNLFVHFEVEFPEPRTLGVEQVRGLLQALPGDSVMSSAEPALRTIPFEKSQVTENETCIHSDYKEDDEEDDPRLAGGQRVQCSGVIF